MWRRRPLALAAGAAALGACALAPTAEPGPAGDEAPPPAGVDARGDLVDVAVPRELRALWVATVANLDFPSRQGLPPARLREELDGIVDRADELRLNALVFQVRPEADAFYRSPREPWSRFLTGRQGRDPGFDPLGYLVERAHGRGIEVHAWFNPYRAKSAAKAPVDERHVSRWASRHTRPWGGLLWMDPGVPQVREHAVDVIADVLSGYDIDGVHLDDYFYPYPDGGRSFPDDDSYATYRRAGGKDARDDWRRSNVDALVEGIAATVRARRPDARFGISPFGIYRPGFPEGVRGLDQVATLHADPLKWLREGWVDYLAPQLYWTTRHPRQPYDQLLAWWDDQADAEHPLFVGLDVTKVGTDPKWTVAEVEKQVQLARAQDATFGEIWFRAEPILDNRAGLGTALARLYETPALPPPLARAARPMAPPDVAVGVRGLELSHPDRGDLKAWVLYRWEGDHGVPVAVLGPADAAAGPVPVDPGTWIVSAVNRVGVESPGVRVLVPGPEGADAAAASD